MNQAGRYRVTIQALQGGTATYYNIRLLLNGTAYATGPSTGTGATSSVALTVDVVVTAGTTLSVLFHSGVNVTNVPAVNDGGQATFMNVQYLGPA
ncbi:hypothetical protein DEJ30_13995 [Curtobacterium sp. MCPF17_003]|nr:hypothetical protein DEJ30_13995 [Curtobacterium sp. MCPF17_003]